MKKADLLILLKCELKQTPEQIKLIGIGDDYEGCCYGLVVHYLRNVIEKSKKSADATELLVKAAQKAVKHIQAIAADFAANEDRRNIYMGKVGKLRAAHERSKILVSLGNDLIAASDKGELTHQETQNAFAWFNAVSQKSDQEHQHVRQDLSLFNQVFIDPLKASVKHFNGVQTELAVKAGLNIESTSGLHKIQAIDGLLVSKYSKKGTWSGNLIDYMRACSSGGGRGFIVYFHNKTYAGGAHALGLSFAGGVWGLYDPNLGVWVMKSEERIMEALSCLVLQVYAKYTHMEFLCVT